MNIKLLPTVFIEANFIINKLNQAGFEAYFVGGSVRDCVLNKPINDIDIATSAYPSELKDVFSKTVDTGIQHGTVMILVHGNQYEVTTFRTESGYQDYRRPDQVKFVRSLKEDLQRRDFTFNALALSKDGEVIDLFEGINDLNNKIVRAVGDPNIRFGEDALRMMRAVRFMSQLDFEVDLKTFEAIKNNVNLLSKIAIERILVEFNKLMLGSNPHKGLDAILETGMLRHLPGLLEIKTVLKNLMIEANLSKLENEIQVWSLISWKANWNYQIINKILKEWKMSNDTINAVQKITTFLVASENNSVDNLSLFAVAGNNLKQAIKVAEIIGLDLSQYLNKYEKLPIKNSKELLVNGTDLMNLVEPGPQLGKLLIKLQKSVLLNEVVNDKKSLIVYARKLLSSN